MNPTKEQIEAADRVSKAFLDGYLSSEPKHVIYVALLAILFSVLVFVLCYWLEG